MAVVTVVSEDGSCVGGAAPWFPEDAGLGAEAMTVVSVLGAQGSGKSSWLNAVLGTGFAVGRRGTGVAGTRGIHAAKAEGNSLLLAFDVEGADSRERGRDGAVFAGRCASFAAALSDVILVNLFVHEVGVVKAAAFSLLEVVFSETAKAIQDGPMKTSVVFVVRDVDAEVDTATAQATLLKDATELWSTCSKGEGGSVDQFFNFDCIFVPHFKYDAEGFAAKAAELKRKLTDNTDPGFLVKTEVSKGIPADGFAAFSSSLWEGVYGRTVESRAPIQASGDVGAVMAADTAFSGALEQADAEIVRCCL